MRRAGYIAWTASVLFAGVGVHEYVYKVDHRYAYGPAVVIAIAALAGCLLAGAVGYMAFNIQFERDEEHRRIARSYARSSED